MHMRHTTRRYILKSLTVAAISFLAYRLFQRAAMTAPRTIVVGGGLAGLSAAHTALENGAIVVLLDKKPAYVLLNSMSTQGGADALQDSEETL